MTGLLFLPTPLAVRFGVFSIPSTLCTIVILFCSERIRLISVFLFAQTIERGSNGLWFLEPLRRSHGHFSWSKLFQYTSLHWGQWPIGDFPLGFCKCCWPCVLVPYSYKQITINLVAQNHKNLLSQVLETRSPKSRCQHDPVPLEALGKNLSHLFQLWVAVGILWLSIFAYVPPPLYVFVLFCLLLGYLSLDWGPTQVIQNDLILRSLT